MANSGTTNTLWPLVTTSTSSGLKCYKKLEYCPKGHQMDKCQTVDGDSGRLCKQCSSLSFQPKRNKFEDNCRLRKSCGKPFMTYENYGTTVTDATCKCELGYHFENEDQRACVPNRECVKGFGQGMYGICENCLEKNMWSDTIDNYSKCKPLKNCEKESRCTVRKSNGTFDNKCWHKVSDVTNCDSIIHQTTTPAPAANRGLIIGLGVMAGVVLIIFTIVLILCLFRRKAARRQRTLTTEEREEIIIDVIKRCRKDEVYCKKVLTIGQKEIEDKINNQIWALLQELFREHTEPAKSEVLLEKLKEQNHKYAVNGYMNDWWGWRGDTGDAVEELVKCLRSDKVKREDILHEIVSKLNEDYPAVVYANTNKRSAKQSTSKRVCATIFPCACKDDEKDSYEMKETSSKLLDAQVINERDNGYMPPPVDKPQVISGGGGVSSGVGDGGNLSPTEAVVVYRTGPTPSAPMILDEPYYDDSQGEVKGIHFYDRSDSSPIQASS